MLVLTRTLAAGRRQHEPGTGVPGVTRVGWSPVDGGEPLTAVIDGATAVVNLAGESLDAKRWTDRRKQAIRESRLDATRALADAIRTCGARPRCSSAEALSVTTAIAATKCVAEDAPAGHDFLARLCAEWEEQARTAERPGLRIVLIRTGIVLERSGGALPRMMLPFRFFAGGPLGPGRQYVSWIHRLDWIETVRWAVDAPSAVGAINATAPHPVTNRQFARALGRAMHRPAVAPGVPRFALRLAVGEIADAVMTGQRAIPAKALAAGFHFRYPEIDIALRGIFEI